MNTEAGNPYDTRSFHLFVDNAFAQFAERRAARLLIDLRNNPGGYNSFSDHMLAWIANRPFRFCSSFRIRVSAQATAANSKRL